MVLSYIYQLHGGSLLLKKRRQRSFAAIRVQLLERRYGIHNGFFKGFPSISVHCRLVLFTMGQVARTANAAAHASHALNEIGVQYILALF